jgi:hypothetical protein
MKAILFCVVLCLPYGLAAQESAKPSMPVPSAAWGSQTMQLKYVNADELRRVFSSQSYAVAVNQELNLLTVRGPLSFIREVEETVKRLDIAPSMPPNVELTVYLLTAAVPGSSAALPPELGDLGKELKAMFGAQALRVADSQVIRVRSGKPADATGLASPAESAATLSWVRFECATVILNAKGNTISLDGLRVGLHLPGNPGATRTPPATEGGVTADLDLVENQPAIIGKAGIDKPVVVIVRAKVTNAPTPGGSD